MPKRKTKSPPSNAVTSFVFVSMADGIAQRLQTQLGLLEATPVDICTPQTFKAPAASAQQITLMVYQDCLPYLQEQMAVGTLPSASLQHWITQAEAFLRSLRTNRASVFPVALDLALGDPDTLRTALKDTYDCVFRNDIPEPIDTDANNDPAQGFLAMDAFVKSSSARRLQAELDACVRGYAVRPVRKTPDIDAAFQNLMQARATHSEQTRDLRLASEVLALKERELTAAQAHTTEALVEIGRLKATHHNMIGALETRITAQRAEIDRLHTAIAQEAGAKNALKSQVDWVQSELRDALTQLDHAAIERSQFHDNISQLHETVQMRDAHIEAIRVSTSWRLTGPLRRFRRLFWKR